jgi:hypothetical protein
MPAAEVEQIAVGPEVLFDQCDERVFTVTRHNGRLPTVANPPAAILGTRSQLSMSCARAYRVIDTSVWYLSWAYPSVAVVDGYLPSVTTKKLWLIPV